MHIALNIPFGWRVQFILRRRPGYSRISRLLMQGVEPVPKEFANWHDECRTIEQKIAELRSSSIYPHY
jgi:hypothetical protein